MAGERVLVVDDSLVYRDLLVNHVLTPNGYEPLTAKDGDTGLRTAQQKVPDLIIMDMRMPGMTGIQVLEALHEAGNEIPVIMMTLHGSEDLAVRAFRLGVKDYVIKPFDIEEMLMAIDKALTEVRLRRERDALTLTLDAVLTNTRYGILLVEDGEAESVILANLAVREACRMDDDVTGQPLTEALRDEILADVFQRAKDSAETAHAEIPLPDERTLKANVTPIPGVGRGSRYARHHVPQGIGPDKVRVCLYRLPRPALSAHIGQRLCRLVTRGRDSQRAADVLSGENQDRC